MNTKYNCDDTVYIPCKISEIKVTKFGVLYKVKLNSNASVDAIDSSKIDIEESALIATMEHIYEVE